MKTLLIGKSMLFGLLVLIAIAGTLSSCEKGVETITEQIEEPVTIEKITSIEVLEELMEAENFEPTREFTDFLEGNGLRTCSNYSWERNSCGNIPSTHPLNPSGGTNYLGGCMELYLVDFFKLSVGGTIYYVCAAGQTNSDVGRYLLRARISNNTLVVSNLNWGDKINANIGIYNSSCSAVTGNALNSISYPL